MKFPHPLIRGTLVRRYKRFLADVTLGNGDVVTAHCANSGSMLGVDAPGSEATIARQYLDVRTRLRGLAGEGTGAHRDQ